MPVWVLHFLHSLGDSHQSLRILDKTECRLDKILDKRDWEKAGRWNWGTVGCWESWKGVRKERVSTLPWDARRQQNVGARQVAPGDFHRCCLSGGVVSLGVYLISLCTEWCPVMFPWSFNFTGKKQVLNVHQQQKPKQTRHIHVMELATGFAKNEEEWMPLGARK